MRMMRIAVSCVWGNPRLEATWSGTPSNLINALEEIGVSVLGINTGQPRWIRAACKLVFHRALGYNGPSRQGPVIRALSARITTKACCRAGIKKVLHIGTTDVPLSTRPDDVERYIYSDSTWNLASSYAAEVSGYSPRSLQNYDELEATAYKRAKHLFPISEFVKRNLEAHYGVDTENITVVGTGRGKIAPFQGKKDYARGPILFVAKDRFKDKGGKLLIEGFNIALAENPSLKLIMAGRAAELEGIPRSPNVTITGRVSWAELEQLFYGGALFAMPASYEPWGLVYLEAMACKMPLLGLARNSLPELTQNGRFGFLIEEPDPTQVAKAILKAFSDPKTLDRMGSEGQSHCLKNFSWQRTACLIRDRMLKDGP